MDISSIVKLREKVTGAWISQAIYIAAKLGLADLLSDGPRSTVEIAAATDSDPDAIYRLMRALASVGIFSEVQPRRFILTRTAEYLKTDQPGSLRHLALFYGEEVFKSWGEALFSVRTGKPAFNQIFQMDLWTYLSRNDDARVNFNIGMGTRRWKEQSPLLEASDLSGVSLLVDVGGGQGSMLATILNAYPTMRGILVDLPSAIEDAPSLLADAAVDDRCQIVSGSAFDPLPPGADAYLFSSVLHSMNDEQVRCVLCRVRDAIRLEGKLLIVERVLPAGDQPHFGKLLDCVMLLLTGGRERSAEEFEELLRSAGFEISRIRPLPPFVAGVDLSLIEALPIE